MDRVYSAAIYLRLSRDEDGKTESESISNQREFLRSFAERQPDICIVKEYVDDGYSGANFERPGFQSMMSDAGDGAIDCIIVKDLSRLGRNYIETGRYLERVFPMMQLRFIAVNDNYDSMNGSDSDQLLVPFKNLINDAYCRDISLKIRSQLDVKRRNGECLSGYAVYGYLKDPEDKHKLVMDPYAAQVVRLIYSLALGGMSPGSVAKKLDSLGVLPPLAYKRSLGINYNSGFRSREGAGWSAAAVRKILTDIIYTGTMRQGKYRKVNHRLKECVPVEEKEWVLTEGTHEAIITRDEFDLMQSILERDTRTGGGKDTVPPFSGYVRCGYCGQNMVRSSMPGQGRGYVYFRCYTNLHGGGCPQKYISEGALVSTVLGAVNLQAQLLTRADEIVKTAENGDICVMDGLLRKQMAQLDEEAERFRNLKACLYQDMRDGVVSREEFTELNSRFSKRITDAEEKIRELERREERRRESGRHFPQWLLDMKKYGESTKIDRRMVTHLIDEIIVWDKERIEIRFRFADEMAQIMELAGLGEEYQEVTGMTPDGENGGTTDTDRANTGIQQEGDDTACGA